MATGLFGSPAAGVAILLLLLLSFLSICFTSSISSDSTLQLQYSRRSLISIISDQEDLDSPIPKSKSTAKKKLPISESMETKNSTKSLKPKKTNSTISSSSSSSPNSSTLTAKSKLNKTLSASIKSKINKTLSAIPTTPKLNLDKTSIISKQNATKPLKPIKILKSNSTKSPLFKSNSTKTQQLKPPNPPSKTQKKLEAEDPPSAKTQSTPKPKSKHPLPIKVDEDDLISEFRDLPSRLQSAFVPDLHKLSTTSKLYLSKTHREISAGMKPFVGKKYAPSIASAALLILPLLLVTVIFRHLIRSGSSASLHRAVLFVQAYLAIYFATLSLTAVATGLEPLRFFYAASPGAYVWTQAVQTFGYVVYLVVQLIALVVAFSVGDGEGASGKAVSMAQMLLGLAVGMHYYITVLHRAVAGEAPRANWKVHGIYATCFVVICGLGRADRRKKAYVQYDGGDAADKKS